MSNITDWIKYELYPSLYEIIDVVLPEHDFKRYAGGWRSKTYLDGTPHKDRIDKTIISKKVPGYILENGGDVIGIIDYVIKRDNADFITAVKVLADTAGLQLPKSEFNLENYQKYKDQTLILESLNSYFKYLLTESAENTNKNDLMAYLTSRGYSLEDIKTMDLGYTPSQEKINTYLIGKGYNQTLIDEVVKIKNDTRIGTTHKLSIPYRSGGVIKGFKFRTIGNTTPKYLNNSGLDKSTGFFNILGLKGEKDVVIVEGELDSLSATIKGIENVVATGGSSISTEQVKDAIKRGAKSFTLCFDNEPSKKEETNKRLITAIEIILETGINKIYVATLPEINAHKIDVDSLIKEKGVEIFKETLAEALPYYEYKLQITLHKYGKIEEKQGHLTKKDEDNLLDEVVEISTQLQPIDKDRFIKFFVSIDAIKELGISEDSLSVTVDRLSFIKDKELQTKALKKLLSTVSQLQNKGEIDKALSLLEDNVKEIKLKDKTVEFGSLLVPITEIELKQRQANKPESLKSGYIIGGEDLLLPSGAISIFAAPTSHGKTTFLINLALNVVQNYTNKEIYFLSYEEDKDSILINALNTYLDNDISANNRRTLKKYFTTNQLIEVSNQDKIHFEENKDRFFRELIDTKRLNIHYANYNSDTLIEAIRYLYKNANPGAIFIDYIQLLNLPKGKYKTYSRQEEIKEICIALKDIAVETGLPIILGAQFNREVINQLKLHATKIGEAGDIERIANLVVGFWNNNFKPLATDGELNEINIKTANMPDSIFISVLKNRSGRVGLEESLSFNGNTGKIKNSSNIDNISNYFNR